MPASLHERHGPRHPDTPLGLIAGEGALPELVARGAHEAGRPVYCLSINGPADPTLAASCDRVGSVAMLRLGAWTRRLRRWGICEAVMVGRVRKATMHHPLAIVRNLPDRVALHMWFRTLRHDRRSQTALTALADHLEAAGVRLIDSTAYIPDHLAAAGHLAGPAPTPAVEAALAFGWPLLTQTNRLQLGQALAVRSQDVVAVEAVEGTDAMIRRAGTLTRGRGFVLLKGSGPGKDPRFDVPTVGVQTLETLAEAGGTAAVLEAGRVILIDRPAVEAAAARLRITLLGVAVD